MKCIISQFGLFCDNNRPTINWSKTPCQKSLNYNLLVRKMLLHLTYPFDNIIRLDHYIILSAEFFFINNVLYYILNSFLFIHVKHLKFNIMANWRWWVLQDWYSTVNQGFHNRWRWSSKTKDRLIRTRLLFPMPNFLRSSLHWYKNTLPDRISSFQHR